MWTRKRTGTTCRGIPWECPTRRGVFDGACYLIDRLGEVSILHANGGLACLFDAVQDLLVLDLQLGIVIGLCLSADTLPVGVVLT